MQRVILKSEIHRATVTRADLEYQGSCAIDSALMRAADVRPHEQVHVVNVSNGSRAVTYALEGAPGEICLNGAMAHLGQQGDIVILMTYASLDAAELDDHEPIVVLVDSHNAVVSPIAERV